MTIWSKTGPTWEKKKAYNLSSPDYQKGRKGLEEGRGLICQLLGAPSPRWAELGQTSIIKKKNPFVAKKEKQNLEGGENSVPKT